MVHAAHSAHAAHAAATASQAGKDVVWALAGAVDPVVQHDDPLGVIVPGLARIVDDEHTVEASVELDPRVRMVKKGGHGEVIGEPAVGADGLLGHPGTPSMSLRRATPCQCTLVVSGNALSTTT